MDTVAVSTTADAGEQEVSRRLLFHNCSGLLIGPPVDVGATDDVDADDEDDDDDDGEDDEGDDDEEDEGDEDDDADADAEEDEEEVGDEPTTLVLVEFCFSKAAAEVVVVVFVVLVCANCTCSTSEAEDEMSSYICGGCAATNPKGGTTAKGLDASAAHESISLSECTVCIEETDSISVVSSIGHSSKAPPPPLVPPL